jgi:hypothetical protein
MPECRRKQLGEGATPPHKNLLEYLSEVTQGRFYEWVLAEVDTMQRKPDIQWQLTPPAEEN